MGSWWRPILGWFAVRGRRNAQGAGEFVDAGHICRIAAAVSDEAQRHVSIELRLLGDLPPEVAVGSTAPQQTLTEDAAPDPDSDYTTDLGTQTLRHATDGWDLT